MEVNLKNRAQSVNCRLQIVKKLTTEKLNLPKEARPQISEVSGLKIGKTLGKGGFAKCHEALDIQSKKLLAVKIVKKSKLAEEENKLKLESEIKLHSKITQAMLNSPNECQNIVKMFRTFKDSKNIYLVLELCENLSLDKMLKRRIRLREVEVRCYAFQVVQALKFLKSQGVVHRDLKLGNLFLDKRMCLKVGDFGLAAEVKKKGRRHSVCGTPNYIAPEVLQSKEGHSFEVDVWALGVICYTLLVGRAPFETRDLTETYKKIYRASYTFPKHVTLSHSAKKFISDCLQPDVSKRVKLEKIEQHEFFRSNFPERMDPSTLTIPPSIAAISENFKLTEKENILREKSRPKTSKKKKQPVANKGIAVCQVNLLSSKPPVAPNVETVPQSVKIPESEITPKPVPGQEPESPKKHKRHRSDVALELKKNMGRKGEKGRTCTSRNQAFTKRKVGAKGRGVVTELNEFDSQVDADEFENPKNNPRYKPTKPSLLAKSSDRIVDSQFNSFQGGYNPNNLNSLLQNAVNKNKISILSKLKSANIPKEEETGPQDESSTTESRHQISPVEERTNKIVCLSNLIPENSEHALISKYTLKFPWITYKLSCGNFGLLFSDGSKIIIANDLHQFYYLRKLEKDGRSSFKASMHSFDRVPCRLKSKVTQINESIMYLTDKQCSLQFTKPSEQDETFYLSKNIVYLNKLKSDKTATILKMSNQLVHIHFKDGTEVLFDDQSHTATILTSDEQILKADIKDNFTQYFIVSKHNYSLNQKLVYAKSVYAKMFNVAPQHPSTSSTYKTAVYGSVSKTLNYESSNKCGKMHRNKHKSPVMKNSKYLGRTGHNRRNTENVGPMSIKETKELRRKFTSQFYMMNSGVQKRNHLLDCRKTKEPHFTANAAEQRRKYMTVRTNN